MESLPPKSDLIRMTKAPHESWGEPRPFVTCDLQDGMCVVTAPNALGKELHPLIPQTGY